MKISGKGEMLLGKGQLTATMQRKAGRVRCNGYPTDVEACHAMVLSNHRSRLQARVIVSQMELQS